MNQCIFGINRKKYDKPKDGYRIEKFQTIIKAGCEYFDVSEEEVRSGTRKHPIVFARQLIMALIYANCPYLSLETIGKHFGGRDNTTTLHSLDAVIEKINSPANDILKTGYYDIVTRLPFDCNPPQRRSARFVYH